PKPVAERPAPPVPHEPEPTVVDTPVPQVPPQAKPTPMIKLDATDDLPAPHPCPPRFVRS
ncbi:hypothetical protein ACSNOI_21225, partial [Actinomadura kijaniata]